MTKTKVQIVGNGCDRRLLDSQKIEDFLRSNNFSTTNSTRTAEYIFISTCAMSQTTEDFSFNLINKYKKYNAKIIVHGCLPQISKEKFDKEFNSEKIIKIDAKDLAEDLDKIFADQNVPFKSIPDPIKLASDQNIFNKLFAKFKIDKLFFLSLISAINFKIKNPTAYLHPRIKKGAYLQLSSGCNDKCSYCAIPKAIGGLKSKPLNQVIHEYSRILENGERSIVFTSDNLGLYGQDINSNIIELFKSFISIDNYYGNVQWTINELHPKSLLRYESEFFDIISKGTIKEMCVPIQSGNNRILKLMKRNYDSEKTTSALSQIKAINKNLRLTTDVIVGFPTETDDEFLDTIKLIAKVRFDQVMFFSYGPRSGTAAKELEYDQLENKNNIVRRMKMAMKLLNKEKINYTFQ